MSVGTAAFADADSAVLPEGWALTHIGHVCEINPVKPASDALNASTPVTFVPMPAVDAKEGAITEPQVKAFADVRKGFTSFRNNDVIMAKITPCMENGKSAIARNLTNGLGFGSTEFHVLRPTDAVLPEFVHNFIRQESYRRAAESEMTGSVGQKRVPESFLELTELPLPPLAEQVRIVKKVTALLDVVKNSCERLSEVPLIMRRFRQMVLAAACSGRLTVDWRETNLDKLTPIPRSPDEIWTDLPECWGGLPVENLCSHVVDCPHSTPKWTSAGVICLRTTNFRPGFLDLSEVRFVSESTYKERVIRLQPQAGDVLYSREGGILGIACMIPPDVRLCLGQRMMLMRTNPELCISAFLMHVLNSPTILARVRELTGGSASPHLNVSEIKAFQIPLPSLSEQRVIVRRVAALLSLADAIERRTAIASELADKLISSILGKSFRGELVPTEAEVARREGREYEPASVLLERIRAIRASDTKTPVPKRKLRNASAHV